MIKKQVGYILHEDIEVAYRLIDLVWPGKGRLLVIIEVNRAYAIILSTKNMIGKLCYAN